MLRCCNRRYNLLREQNEGYGKLLAELLSGGTLQPEQVPAVEQQIKRHIGTFNLDPNRCDDMGFELGTAHTVTCMHTQTQPAITLRHVPPFLVAINVPREAAHGIQLV